eukprot:scaffold41533_cov39-Phaeocystis_antarctica.AAC.3
MYHSLNRVQFGMMFCQYAAWQTGLPSEPRLASTSPVTLSVSTGGEAGGIGGGGGGDGGEGAGSQ